MRAGDTCTIKIHSTDLHLILNAEEFQNLKSQVHFDRQTEIDQLKKNLKYATDALSRIVDDELENVPVENMCHYAFVAYIALKRIAGDKI